MVGQKKLAGITLTISGKAGNQETVFLTRKYGGTSQEATAHEDIAQRIVNHQRNWNERIITEENEQPRDPQPPDTGWLREGKVSRRVLLRIAGGFAIAGPLAGIGMAVAELIHSDSRTLFVDQGHTNQVHSLPPSPHPTSIAS